MRTYFFLSLLGRIQIDPDLLMNGSFAVSTFMIAFCFNKILLLMFEDFVMADRGMTRVQLWGRDPAVWTKGWRIVDRGLMSLAPFTRIFSINQFYLVYTLI